MSTKFLQQTLAIIAALIFIGAMVMIMVNGQQSFERHQAAGTTSVVPATKLEIKAAGICEAYQKMVIQTDSGIRNAWAAKIVEAQISYDNEAQQTKGAPSADSVLKNCKGPEK